jgi:hypothetical protein
MEDWDAVQSAASSSEGGRKPCFIREKYSVPWKALAKTLQSLESKERPGMVSETVIEEMLGRFITIFRVDEADAAERKKTLHQRLQHLRTTTLQRCGPEASGWIDWERSYRNIFDLFTLQLNKFERIFFTVDVSDSSSWAAQITSIVLISTIVLSITTWMLSTMPEVRSIPETSDRTGQRCNDPNVIHEVGDCEPKEIFFFQFMEHFCVFLFTLEFLIKFSVVSQVRFELNQMRFLEGALRGSHNHNQLSPHWKTLLKWFLGLSTMIDVVAIFPYWLERITGDSGGSAFVILRILRLTRVFRVFKIGKYNEVFSLFGRVMAQSLPALYLMLFFVGLGLCLFGTLIWFCEAGEWFPQGNPEVENLGITERGAYLRNVAFLDGVEELDESPFPSIIHTFWFVIVTVTTVGYGDAFPTTREGKFMGSLTMLCGVVVLAMPVGVIGANFSNEYERVQADTRRRAKLMQQRMEKEARAKEAKAGLTKSRSSQSGIAHPAGDMRASSKESKDLSPAAKQGEEEPSLEAEDETTSLEVLGDLRSIEAIMDRAIGLDAELVSLLDLQAAQRPRKDLREFLQEMIRRLDKVGTREQTNSLDQLTYRTFAQFRSCIDFSPNAGGKPSLADIRAFRQRWFAFMDQCWVHWVEHTPRPLVNSEIFELKGELLLQPRVQMAG